VIKPAAASSFTHNQAITTLPVPTTAVEAATATAMETTAAYVTVYTTTSESATNCARSAVASTSVAGTSVAIAGSPITVTGPPVDRPSVEAAAVAIAVTVAAAEPRSGTDKEAAAKPRRTIVPIRGAGIRIIAVVAIRADRGRIPVAPVDRTADTYTNCDLGVGISCCREQENTE
jgi:hypothetical protein